jgi:hypothetical protein
LRKERHKEQGKIYFQLEFLKEHFIAKPVSLFQDNGEIMSLLKSSRTKNSEIYLKNLKN